MDINNDGKFDIIAGDTDGAVTLFLNKGVKGKPVLAAGEKIKADGKEIMASKVTYKVEDGRTIKDKTIPGSHELALVYSKLHVADWDADGLADILVGHNNTIIFYKNTGSKAKVKFAAPKLIENPEGKFPSRPSPYIVDWDGDGKKDLLSGGERPVVTFYRNVGTDKEPKLAEGVDLKLAGPDFDKGYRCRIDVTDWNNDGKLDILVGNFFSYKQPMGGNIWLFLGK
ncbi:MAG: VCBS repeat-containing protein [Planctomycetes bacterium]|nr:VCBS repeat-containing protein [Planctomycetota bacterium]